MALPLMLISYFFFLGFGLGNVGLIMLFVGHITVVPTVTALLQWLTSFRPSLFAKPGLGEICNLVPYSGVSGSAFPPSYWVAHIVFFAAYAITNASFLYTEVAQDNADEEKVLHRKEQAITSIVLISIAALSVLTARYVITGCETPIGLGLATLAIAPLGFGWYKLASLCGARNADVFGIAAKMLPYHATDPPPIMCVPS